MRFIILTLFIITTYCSIGQTLTGKVVGISDGDTFTLLDTNNTQIKIRLHGIDCPESDQAFGQVAKKELSNLVFSKQVKCVQTDIDRYGRTIAKIYIDESPDISINEILLQKGMAWHFKRYDSNPAWAEMEVNAKNAKIGLWAEPNPIYPSEYRKIKKGGN